MNKHSEIATFTIDMTRSKTTHFADWRLAVKSILGFWTFYALTLVARALLGTDPTTALENWLFICIAGIIVTLLVYAAIAALGHRSTVRGKAAIATAASVLAGCTMSAVLISAEPYMR